MDKWKGRRSLGEEFFLYEKNKSPFFLEALCDG